MGATSGVLATVVVGGAYYGLEQALLQPEALWLNEFTKCMWPFMDIIWPLLGGFVLFGVAIGGVGCASSIRQAPEGVIFFEHRSFLWKSIKNWSASYVWCLPH